MKISALVSALGLTLSLSAPASAGTQFVVDFEKSWGYGEAVDATYGVSGVLFSNMLGLSNEPGFNYFSNSPSPQGVGFAQLDFVTNTAAYMNVAEGVVGGLDLFYASPIALTGAVKAYSGLNGTGELLGVFDLAANSSEAYDGWSAASFGFNGRALSFDFTGAANIAAFDNISALPEPGQLALLLAAGGGMLIASRRHRRG